MLSLALLALVALASAADHVITLTDENFDRTIASNDIILVEFYAPWCGHCKRLEPEYAKAAEQLAGRFPLAKLDATEHRKAAGQFQIQGFPTLKIFRKGRPFEYRGGRTADTIVPYLERQLLPAIQTLTAAALRDAPAFSAAVPAKISEPLVIQILAAGETASETTPFGVVAVEQREHAKFFATTEANLLSQVAPTAKAGDVWIVRSFDSRALRFDGNAQSSAALTDWLSVNRFPLLGEMNTAEQREKYSESGMTIVSVFINPKADNAAMLATCEQAATELRSLVIFTVVDGPADASAANNLGLSGNVFPALALFTTTRVPYAYDEASPFPATRALVKWVSDALAEKIAPSVRSEPIPTQQPNAVVNVVGKTFDQLVLRNKKHVLMEFYAPWCGHCKNFEPIYESIAQKLKEHRDIVVAKMDATKNDIAGPEPHVQGYPTIRLYLGNNKTSPIKYEGDRTEAAVLAWIEQKTGISLTSSGSKKPQRPRKN